MANNQINSRNIEPKINQALDYLNSVDSINIFKDCESFDSFHFFIDVNSKSFYRDKFLSSIGKIISNSLDSFYQLINTHNTFRVKYCCYKDPYTKQPNEIFVEVYDSNGSFVMYRNDIKFDINELNWISINTISFEKVLNFLEPSSYESYDHYKNYQKLLSNFLSHDGLSKIINLLKLASKQKNIEMLYELFKVLHNIFFFDLANELNLNGFDLSSYLEECSINNEIIDEDDLEMMDEIRGIIEQIELLTRLKGLTKMLRDDLDVDLFENEDFINKFLEFNRLTQSFAYYFYNNLSKNFNEYHGTFYSLLYLSYLIVSSGLNFGKIFASALNFYSNKFKEADFKYLSENQYLKELYKSSPDEIRQTDKIKYFLIHKFIDLYLVLVKMDTNRNTDYFESFVLKSVVNFLKNYKVFNYDFNSSQKNSFVSSLTKIGKKIIVNNSRNIDKNIWINFNEFLVYNESPGDEFKLTQKTINFLCMDKFVITSLDKSKFSPNTEYVLSFFARFSDFIRFLYQPSDLQSERNIFKSQFDSCSLIYEFVDYIFTENQKLFDEKNDKFKILKQLDNFQNILTHLSKFIFIKLENLNHEMIKLLYQYTSIVCAKEKDHPLLVLGSLMFDFLEINFDLIQANLENEYIKKMLASVWNNVDLSLNDLNLHLIINIYKTPIYLQILDNFMFDKDLKEKFISNTYFGLNLTNDHLLTMDNKDFVNSRHEYTTHYSKKILDADLIRINDALTLRNNIKTDIIFSIVKKNIEKESKSTMIKLIDSEIEDGYLSNILVLISSSLNNLSLNELGNLNFEDLSLKELDYNSYLSNLDQRLSVILYNLSYLLERLARIKNKKFTSNGHLWKFCAKLYENKGIDAIFKIIEKYHSIYLNQNQLFENLFNVILMLTKFELLKSEQLENYKSLFSKFEANNITKIIKEISFYSTKKTCFELIQNMLEVHEFEDLMNRAGIENLAYVYKLISLETIDLSLYNYKKFGKFLARAFGYFVTKINDIDLSVDVSNILDLTENNLLDHAFCFVINITYKVMLHLNFEFLTKIDRLKQNLYRKRYAYGCKYFISLILSFINNKGNEKIGLILDNKFDDSKEAIVKLKKINNHLNSYLAEETKIKQELSNQELVLNCYPAKLYANIAWLIKNRNEFYFYTNAKHFSEILIKPELKLTHISVIIEHATRIRNRCDEDKAKFTQFNSDFFRYDGVGNILTLLSDDLFLKENLNENVGKVIIRNLLFTIQNLKDNETNHEEAVWLNAREVLASLSKKLCLDINYIYQINLN